MVEVAGIHWEPLGANNSVCYKSMRVTGSHWESFEAREQTVSRTDLGHREVERVRHVDVRVVGLAVVWEHAHGDLTHRERRRAEQLSPKRGELDQLGLAPLERVLVLLVPRLVRLGPLEVRHVHGDDLGEGPRVGGLEEEGGRH